jgi:hypothetical protein
MPAFLLVEVGQKQGRTLGSKENKDGVKWIV